MGSIANIRTLGTTINSAVLKQFKSPFNIYNYRLMVPLKFSLRTASEQGLYLLWALITNSSTTVTGINIFIE